LNVDDALSAVKISMIRPQFTVLYHEYSERKFLVKYPLENKFFSVVVEEADCREDIIRHAIV